MYLKKNTKLYYIRSCALHTSSILCSNWINTEEINRTLNNVPGEGVSQLPVVVYKGETGQHVDMSINTDFYSISSFEEAFPWYSTEDGQSIDYQKQIKLFEAVKLVSKYLETRFAERSENISTIKISDIVAPFESKEALSVEAFLNHINTKYSENKSLFLKLAKDLEDVNPNKDFSTQEE